MGENNEACPYLEEHPEFRVRFQDLERRMTAFEHTQEERWTRVWEALSDVRDRLSNLSGRMVGYLVAAAVVSTIVGVLAQALVTHFSVSR